MTNCLLGPTLARIRQRRPQHNSCKISIISLLQQLRLESLEEICKIQRLVFMYKILNGQVAVPTASVDHILCSRPSRRTNANQHTTSYRLSIVTFALGLADTDYCEILHWEFQTVLQHQDSERLEGSTLVHRASWISGNEVTGLCRVMESWGCCVQANVSSVLCDAVIALFTTPAMFLKIGWRSYLGRSKSD